MTDTATRSYALIRIDKRTAAEFDYPTRTATKALAEGIRDAYIRRLDGIVPEVADTFDWDIRPSTDEPNYVPAPDTDTSNQPEPDEDTIGWQIVVRVPGLTTDFMEELDFRLRSFLTNELPKACTEFGKQSGRVWVDELGADEYEAHEYSMKDPTYTDPVGQH